MCRTRRDLTVMITKSPTVVLKSEKTKENVQVSVNTGDREVGINPRVSV